MQPEDGERTWTVGALATEMAVNPKTIRYYGEIGILPAAHRTAAGYRVYGPRDRDRLRFILKGKALGLTLDEIRSVLGLHGQGRAPCGRVLELIDQKLRDVDARLLVLNQYRDELVALRDEAGRTRGAAAAICGIIEQHESACPATAAAARIPLSEFRRRR